MVLLLIGSFAWTTGLGFMTLAVPLYANHLGFSGIAIGGLIALPQLLHLTARLLGGALLDRVGEKRLLLVSYGSLVASGPIYYTAPHIEALFAAQLLAMLSRSTYWISVQTYASRFTEARNQRLGWLSATNNAGQILGMIGAGLLIALVGYAPSFLCLSVLGLVSLLSALALRSRPIAARPRRPFAHFPELLRQPALYFAVLCSFLGALPVTLTASFYPLYLVDIGAGLEATGYVSALRGVGAVISGLLLARFLSAVTRLPITLVHIAAFGVLIALTPLFARPVALALILLGLGLGSALMELTSQLTISEATTDEKRGSAMALGSVGYNLSFLLVPPFFGFVRDHASLDAAFILFGALLLFLAPIAVLLHRKARPAEQRAPWNGFRS